MGIVRGALSESLTEKNDQIARGTEWEWRRSGTSTHVYVVGASCCSQYTLLCLALHVFNPKP